MRAEVRVGIQSGMPFGASFWKKNGAAAPSRKRFIVNGRSRRCGRTTGRDGRVVVEQVALGDALARPELAVGAREPHAALATGDDALVLLTHAVVDARDGEGPKPMPLTEIRKVGRARAGNIVLP